MNKTKIFWIPWLTGLLGDHFQMLVMVSLGFLVFLDSPK